MGPGQTAEVMTENVASSEMDNVIDDLGSNVPKLHDIENRLSRLLDRIAGTNPDKLSEERGPKPVVEGALPRLNEIFSVQAEIADRISSLLTSLEDKI